MLRSSQGAWFQEDPEDDDDVICRCKDLILMYLGSTQLLLKDPGRFEVRGRQRVLTNGSFRWPQNCFSLAFRRVFLVPAKVVFIVYFLPIQWVSSWTLFRCELRVLILKFILKNSPAIEIRRVVWQNVVPGPSWPVVPQFWNVLDHTPYTSLYIIIYVMISYVIKANPPSIWLLLNPHPRNDLSPGHNLWAL